MNFKEQIERKYILAAPMKPTKVVRNKDGVPVEVYEREEMRAFLWATMFNNGGIWMPEVHVKVYKDKESDSDIIYKNVYMSKREFSKAGLKKSSSNEDKKPVFLEYVKKHKDKYRTLMNQLFNEAEREIKALEKHSPSDETGITPHAVELVKSFINNPNQAHTKDLLMDMKDKGYLRPMQRGERKGQLLTDMKAINRVVLNNKLLVTPSGISALIAKDLADKLLKWTRWGFSMSLLSDISHWARKVSELFNFSHKETEDFKRDAHKAVEYYSKEIHKIVVAFNQKLKENPNSNEALV